MELLDRNVFQKFGNNIAIKYYNSKEIACDVSYDQLWQHIQKIASILQEQKIEGRIVGVELPHCPALIAVIGGIIISGNGFHCLDSSWNEQRSREHDLCAAYFLQDIELNRTCNDLQMLLGFRVCTMPLTFALRKSGTEFYRELAFCITTSGSTGQPKTVLVPRTCIMSNVLSLSERFALCEHDVIFVCSPSTFDPFVVDIVMGLRAGATLLLVENSLRLSAKRLLDILFPRVTVMQMTPSMFTRWSRTDMMHTIFGPQTTLRTLVLGGEHFPILQRPADCRVNVYNIYGITEVSCWSMIQRVFHDNQTDVSLGEAIDESIILQIRNSNDESLQADLLANGSVVGQLYIGSCSRKCVILGENNDDVLLSTEHPLFRATGDLVELSKEGNYYYRGRCSRVIKRLGCRISLTELESVLQTHPSVEQCTSWFFDEQHRLVMFYKTNTEDPSLCEALWVKMREKLRTEKLPDEMHRIEQFPLTAHGKICPKGLSAIYENLKQSLMKNCISPTGYFRAELIAMGILHQSHAVKSSRAKKLKTSSSFMDRGGTSYAAICLHATLEENFKLQLPGLVALLLDPLVPLVEAIEYVELKDTSLNGCFLEDEDKVTVPIEKLLLIVRHYDLQKCVDSRGSIAFYQNIGSILSIGSHSGMLLTININTNAVISRVFLPDRIECSVSFFTIETNVYGVVGCYDGFLYCFNPREDGSIAWKYDAGGMIKSAPLVVPPSKVIIFGSYSTSHNLHCIVAGNRSYVIRWRIRIGTKPILSQPVALGGDDAELVLVATLDGNIAAVSIATGCLVWQRTSLRNIPIFSSPTFLPEYNKFACCSVDGALGIYDASKGTELTTHMFPGNVFSSLVVLKHLQDRVDFFVGCYDRHVHCVEYSPASGEILVEKWKVEVQSQIYATPLLIRRHLIVCTTSGWINLIDTDDTSEVKYSIVASIKMKGELFASPVAYGTKMFVGCRDNYLYEILVKV